MKVFGRIIEKGVRAKVKLDDMQLSSAQEKVP